MKRLVGHVANPAVALTIVLASCRPDVEPTASASYAITTAVIRPAEDPLLAISNQSPTFAGYYCEQGDLIVGSTAAITDSSTDNLSTIVASTGVAKYCRSRFAVDKTPNVVPVQMKYSFLSLRKWRDAIGDQFRELAGARGLSIDYMNNRIIMGVEAGQESAATNLASSLQLPDDSYTIVQATFPTLMGVACPPPPYNGTTLRNCFRPVPGGVAMLAWPSGGQGTTPYTQGTLTLASPLWSSGANAFEPGFVTCSHCVPDIDLQQSDWVSQPGNDSSDGINQLIAVEWIDAPGTPCGTLTCKYSDSAWLAYYQGSSGISDNGTIAQTLYWNGTLNSCNEPNPGASCIVNTNNNRFRVYDTATPMTGVEVEKIGNNSGWTSGTISDPCSDQADDHGNWYYCNIIASNQVFGGDSGSPLFYWNTSTLDPNAVEMEGIVWGADNIHPTIASPWSAVLRDLGTLDYKDHAYFLEWATVNNAKAIAGDFNGDHRTDIALVGGDGWGSIPVAFSNGDGTFSLTNAAVSNFPGWANTSGVKVAVGDINNDGRDDIVLTGGSGWNTIPVAFSNGDGTFSVTNKVVGTLPGYTTASTVKLMTGDVNGDGKKDLIVVGVPLSNGIWVATSDGTGNFTAQLNVVSGSFPSWSYASGVMAVAGDFDHNGYPDVALAGGANWTWIPVAFGHGNGSWTTTQATVANFPGWAQVSGAKLLAGDVNGDLKTDLMLTGGSGWSSLPVAFSDGNGNFTNVTNAVTTFASWSQASGAKAVSGDFNNDGKFDAAAVGGSPWWTLPIAQSNGDGSWTFVNKLSP